MAIVVQKFGGTSVADVERMRRCVRHVLRARERGDQVAIVVSAMGKTTDRLVGLASDAWDGLDGTPPRREMDMLLSSGEQVSIAVMAMVLESLGQPAISFLGRQIGMTTDEAHTKARIASIDAPTIRRELDAGRVVVIAGFQGETPDGEITTLGRGGSDTTAVAIAAAIEADVCEIYTDVDGVYTADPRKVPGARRLETVGYGAMLEMAALGAGVLHPRAVQFGARFNVPIRVLHSQADEPTGTLICKETPEMETIEVTSVALKEDLGRITLTELPNTPGVAARIFARLAAGNVFVDDIIQTVVRAPDGASSATVSFTVDHADLTDIRPLLDAALAEVGGGTPTIDVGFCKVSAAGVGIRAHAGVAAKMFGALSDVGVNIANITTSEQKISAILDKADGQTALRAVHDAFDLGA
ncbi:MAG: aspartate kinase [Planctomycetota bacterium]